MSLRGVLAIVGFPKKITQNTTHDIKKFEETAHWQEVD